MEVAQAFAPTFTAPAPVRALPTPVRAVPMADALAACGSGEILEFEREDRIFNQGDPTDTVLWIIEGRVRLSIGSSSGREAVIGTLGAGAFLGEEGVAGKLTMLETATAMTPCRVRSFSKEEMLRLLRADGIVSRKFSAHLLSRRIRLEADLADQLTQPSERRLARRLYLLARESSQDGTEMRVPAEISQSLLADMVGTTRSRVNMFLTRFKKCGFIQYDHGIRIDASMRKLLGRS